MVSVSVFFTVLFGVTIITMESFTNRYSSFKKYIKERKAKVNSYIKEKIATFTK